LTHALGQDFTVAFALSLFGVRSFILKDFPLIEIKLIPTFGEHGLLDVEAAV
jgi:hypothetical protein